MQVTGFAPGCGKTPVTQLPAICLAQRCLGSDEASSQPRICCSWINMSSSCPDARTGRLAASVHANQPYPLLCLQAGKIALVPCA